MKTAAIIIARLKSKRLPRKNLLDLCGKPLFCWNLEKALKIFPQTYFSSDSEEMQREAEARGAIVIKRPEELAGDNVPNMPVFEHAYKYMDNPDLVVSLQSNSPTLPEDLIKRALKIMEIPKINELITIDKNLHVHGSIWALRKERLLNYGDPFKYKAEIFLSDDSVDVHTIEDFKQAEEILQIRKS